MFHVMEHFTQPMETLFYLHRLLKDNGVLAIEIPIVDTLYPLVMGQRHRHFVFDHTSFLSRKNAAEFLHKAGFTILDTELTGRTLRLERIALVLGRHPRGLGRFLGSVFRVLHIEDWIVHINLRDNYRIYCRKAA